MQIMMLPFLIGLAALTTQVVFLRELTIVFYGNELTFSLILAVWFFWGGLGSLTGGFISSRLKNIRTWTGFLIMLYSFSIPAFLYLARIIRNCFGLPQGEVIGINEIGIIAFLVLSLPAFLLTFTFICIVETKRRESLCDLVPTHCYLWEAGGSGVAGLFLSFLLLRFLNSFEIILVLSAMLFLSGWCLLVKKWPARLLGALLSLSLILSAPFLHKISLQSQWSRFNILEARDTAFGNLVVASRQDQISFFENGFLMSSTPDVKTKEFLVHPALTIHPLPEKVLLLGESSQECLNEVLKHPVQQIVATELDPLWIKLKNKYLAPIASSPDKIRLIQGDGRRFLKRSDEKFDVIINALPEPNTLLLNRYYTREFLEEAKRSLRPRGVLSIQLPGMANYPSPELVKLVQSVRFTAQQVFDHVAILPLESTTLLLSDDPQSVSENPDDYLASLRHRNIQTLYFNENYLPFYMTQDRLEQFKRALDDTETLVNLDYRPIAQFYATLFWSAYASPEIKTALDPLSELPHFVWFALPFFWLLLILISRPLPFFNRAVVLNSIGWTGLSEIGFELTIVLSYQAIFGYAYLWIAVILASFMIGLVGGSLLTLRIQSNSQKLYQRLRKVQFWIIFYPLFLAGILVLSQTSPFVFHPLFEYGFPFLATLAGIFGGLQFPLAQRILAKDHAAVSTGLVYGVDLLGSCLGALIIGSFLVPTLGAVQACLLISLWNLISWIGLTLKKNHGI